MPDIAFNPSGLFATGERLPAIKAWLADTIWSPDRYLRLDPEEFLRTGETEVCRLEELVSTGAPQVWDELQADSQRAPTIKSWLGLDARLPTIHHPSSTIHDAPSTNPAAPSSIIRRHGHPRPDPVQRLCARGTNACLASRSPAPAALPLRHAPRPAAHPAQRPKFPETLPARRLLPDGGPRTLD